MYVWRIVHRWLDVLILLVVVVVAGGRLADGLQGERLVGARCRRSERTLPGELHAASGVRSLTGVWFSGGNQTGEEEVRAVVSTKLWRQLLPRSRKLEASSTR